MNAKTKCSLTSDPFPLNQHQFLSLNIRNLLKLLISLFLNWFRLPTDLTLIASGKLIF